METYSCGELSGQVQMSSPAQYRKEFVDRVRIARVSAGFSQGQIASLLGIDANTYAKYEQAEGQASMLPNHLVEVFCIATKISEKWLMTARGAGPQVANPMKRSRVTPRSSRSGKARSS